jgi:hypothetical protein
MIARCSLLAVALVACHPPPTHDAANPAAAAWHRDWDGDLHLAANEDLFTDPMNETLVNPRRWTPRGGPSIGLEIVVATVPAADLDHATLRAIVGHTVVPIGEFSFNSAYDLIAEWDETPDGRIVFRGGDTGGSQDPGTVQLYLLGWDAAAGTLRVVERWSGTGLDDVPAWAAP